MSDSVRPEITAFQELESLVRHLGDELAGFRKRAFLAEARIRDLEGQDADPARQQRRELDERCAALERENAALKARVDAASVRTRQLLDRVRFIRQQSQNGADR